MKNLVIILLALFARNVSAQVHFEDDFSNGLAAWTLTDYDDDGRNWFAVNYTAGDGQGNVATSISRQSMIFTPDNWMVAGPIDLSDAGETVIMEWVAKNQSIYWNNEEYHVYVGTSNTILELEASPYSFSEILDESDLDYVLKSLDISGLSGEDSVYIAFRHYISESQFRINIDDVVVRTVLDHDIKMASVRMLPFVESGTLDLHGTVINYGLTEINSFEIDWNDGTSHTEAYTETIAPGESFHFTHSIPLNTVAGETYTITYCASLIGDENTSNDCISEMVSCVSEVLPKYIVALEKTGTWCGWCPRSPVAFDKMKSEEEYFIGIAVHNNDPMMVETYDLATSKYIDGGIPRVAIDNVLTGSPNNISFLYHLRATEIVPCAISVSYVDEGSSIDVTVTADFVAGAEGDYRLSAVIKEDGVTGTGSGYDQKNYYSGGGFGEMGGYEDLPNPVPAADMVYDDVARALGNDAIFGTEGSLPPIIAAGETFSYTYTFPKGEEWDFEYLQFVGMLINATTGEIINAGVTAVNPYLGLEEAEAEFNLSVYPNPATTTANIKVRLIEPSNVSIEIYNTVGEIVYTKNIGNLTTGAYIYTVNTNTFSAGLYTVKITVNNSSKTAKLSIQ